MYDNIKEFYGIIDILNHRCVNATDDLRENLVAIRADNATTTDEHVVINAMLADVFTALSHLYHLRSLNNSMFVADEQKGDTPHD